MESNHSSLREVLNSIASIQHELVNDQTQMMDSALLGKIKLLAAQLYMEVDIELLSMEFPELEFPELDVKEAVLLEEEVVEELEAEVVDIAPKVEAVFEPVVEVVPVVDVVPVVEVAPVVEVTPVVEVAPVVEMPTSAEPKMEAVVENTASFTVNGVIGQMPLSRRFEFSNILFGGDMEKMGLFIQQMIDAPNASARLDVYDHWYEEKQWRRREESASDMLRMLKRIFAS
jgi:hypothetical protein